MKKFLALLLAVVMILSLAACNGGNGDDATGGSENNKPVRDPNATYTYNYAMSEFPTVWNIHTYQTATDAEIADYITSGFYSFDYNENVDGFEMVMAMATEYPVDVTKDYVGKYGVAEGESGKVYVIKLRDDLKWEDGSKITAKDFEESGKLLLNSKAVNYRADSLYSGNMVLVNAKNYAYNGRTVKEANSNNGETMTYAFADLVKGADGTYTTPNGEKAYFGLLTKYAWLGGRYTLTTYADAGYIPKEGCWDVLTAAANEDGFVPVTDETIAALFLFTNSDVWGNESKDDLGYYVSYDYTYGETPWEEVGMKALSDYELLIALETPLSGFYLHYSLTGSWLVNIDLYNKCTTIDENGMYSNTYGTSVETTMSYGPYKLTYFEKDKQFKLKRNEHYYNLSEDTYWTTDIVVDCVEKASTRLELFQQGKLDTYGLDATDMEKYSKSDHCYYATGDSTFAMVFNPDVEALKTKQEEAGENKNKTILSLIEFRQAMSFAMDRAAFCLATSPTNSPAFGLYSTVIISDPESGTAYRTTDVSKNVIASFWGVSEEYGEGKLYADIDEAIDSITGYNLTKAKELFNAAYDKAIADKLMDADDVVEIKIGTPNSTSNFYKKGAQFIIDNYTEAVKGTKLEGKLTFTIDDTLGNGFSDALKANQVDMLFGVGWTGSALDPYGLMEAYVGSNYQYDPSTDFTTIQLEIEIDGAKYTASVWDWYCVMAGQATTITNVADKSTKEYSCGTNDNDPETRLEILGALEGAVLMNYNFIPLMDDSSAVLKGQQINYYTEEYIFGMGFGGLKYYTYQYTDAEWDAYVASQNNLLDYE